MLVTKVRILLFALIALQCANASPADEFAQGVAAFAKADYAAAHGWLTAAAENGDTRVASWLGADYYIGWGVAPDKRLADLWIEQAKSEPDASDVEAALSQWHRLADSGDAAGQVMLGVAYERGLGVTASPVEAFKWYRLAADQGHARGQYSIGAMYANGTGVKRDAKEALKWLQLAAAQGDTWAQYEIGGAYLLGDGVRRNFKIAGQWLTQAAVAGNALAQYNLGVMYDQGDGFRQDYAEAFKWYQLAAAQGVSDAQNNLGSLYYRGQGTARDVATAFQFSTLAHNQVSLGGPGGQHHFDIAYRTIQQDLSEGDRRTAVFHLGERCRDGADVPRDAVQAYRYMQVSIQNETDEQLKTTRLKSLDDLAALMSPSQISRAQSLAATTEQP